MSAFPHAGWDAEMATAQSVAMAECEQALHLTRQPPVYLPSPLPWHARHPTAATLLIVGAGAAVVLLVGLF